jgi:hypothetical protein
MAEDMEYETNQSEHSNVQPHPTRWLDSRMWSHRESDGDGEVVGDVVEEDSEDDAGGEMW